MSETAELVETTDEALAAALACELNAGFEALARVYAGRLFAFACRMAPSREDAEELAQDALVRAYRALAGYDAERRRTLRVRPWLFAITVNVCRNFARRRGLAMRSLDAPTRDGEVALAEPEAERHERPEQQAEAAETRRELATAIASLPEHLRLAVVLRHVEGMSYAEAAEALRAPVGTVKAQVHRGTRLLRAALEGHEQENELGVHRTPLRDGALARWEAAR